MGRPIEQLNSDNLQLLPVFGVRGAVSSYNELTHARAECGCDFGGGGDFVS